ncbi:MAG: hypothetical protein N2578_09490, partial [Bdellovibrionaceae bacterium]|nr:hypothetical protein [Pseudobdellovibrionaceae bacterium]
SHKRALALHRQSPALSGKILREFEENFSTKIKSAFASSSIDLRDLWGLVDIITWLEEKTSAPLLYNFRHHFTSQFRESLLALHCFLFNMRALVALHYNAQVSDPSHEALKVDSISDYLPRPDYIISDALLYHQVKKITKPFVAGRQSDIKVEKLLVEPVLRAFHQYVHNATHLIDHLPEGFLADMPPARLPESLQLVQMDWLLGSDSGILFRIREEVYGLQHGYEKIFWHEAEDKAPQDSYRIALVTQISESHFRPAVA